MGRRAQHADSRDVRGRRYKPQQAPDRCVYLSPYIAAGRLRRPIEQPPAFTASWRFVAFLIEITSFVSVPSFLL